MNENEASMRLPESLLRAVDHWNQQQQAREGRSLTQGVTLALSREEGAGGNAVAREVAVRLGWPVYDHELLEHIAREMKLRVQLLESMDEKNVSWLEESIAAFSNQRVINENTFIRHLIGTILSLSRHGDCVIVGRGAPHILPRGTTLRVRFIANFSDRVARVMKERQLAAEDAEAHVRTTDQERADFMKRFFQLDPADPHHYDLVENTSFVPLPDCAEIIIEALRRMKNRPLR